MNDLLRQSKPILIMLAVCGLLIGGIVWLTGMEDSGSEVELAETEEIDLSLPAPLSPEEMAAYDVDVTDEANPVVVLNTSMGVIEIELFEDQMPITAGNFKKLVSENFYDGIKFHRVIDGFMVQGGDPNTRTDEVLTYGKGGPGYTIPDEHIKGELLTNVRGTIAMANVASQPNSGGSQFFINLSDNTRLDFDKFPIASQHPVFGRVVSGMDVVDAIGKVETNTVDMPYEAVVIESAVIKGQE